MPEPILDPALLARLRRIGGAELVTQLIDSFRGDAPARLAEMRRALAAGDLPALAAVAHTLVAGAGQLGASALSAEARGVEEAVRSGADEEARTRAPALFARLDEALTALASARESA